MNRLLFKALVLSALLPLCGWAEHWTVFLPETSLSSNAVTTSASTLPVKGLLKGVRVEVAGNTDALTTGRVYAVKSGIARLVATVGAASTNGIGVYQIGTAPAAIALYNESLYITYSTGVIATGLTATAIGEVLYER